nr:FxDxF family PEP-CTERM protein [uncultured Duganella sp.]
MKLKLLAAALLAGVAFSASADNNSYAITLGNTVDFDDIGTVFSGGGGADTITFTGLSAGLYHVVLSYSGVDVKITQAQLNGADTFEFYTPSGSLSLGGFELDTNSPFTLKLWGTTSGVSPSYSGSILVTAVPEPATYGMMLGGLGLLGLAARRRNKKES